MLFAGRGPDDGSGLILSLAEAALQRAGWRNRSRAADEAAARWLATRRETFGKR